MDKPNKGNIGTTQQPPKDYTWHHLDDYDPETNTGTMQLVKRTTREATYPHNGGVAIGAGYREKIRSKQFMTITDTDAPLSEDDISNVENSLGIRLPHTVRQHYMKRNGGRPNPYVFENPELSTVVSEILPLKTNTKAGTAPDSYKHLILSKRLLANNFFPFAIEGGGDYFFIDCSREEAPVYFLRSDDLGSELGRPLIELCSRFEEFWEQLKSE